MNKLIKGALDDMQRAVDRLKAILEIHPGDVLVASLKANQEAITAANKVYSVADVAKLTSLSKSFIRNEIRVGKLKAKKVGRRVLISKKDLATYLNNQPDWEGEE